MKNDGDSTRFTDEAEDEVNRPEKAVNEDEDGGGDAIPPFVVPRVKEVRRLGAP
jgi:hypothetical protein